MALSDDLRKRMAGAVVSGGLSRNAAASRFCGAEDHDRPMNAALFQEWVEKCLAPNTLSQDILSAALASERPREIPPRGAPADASPFRHVGRILGFCYRLRDKQATSRARS